MPQQLSNVSNFDCSNIIFNDPQKHTVPDSKPPIAYTRVQMQVRHPDGTTGDLILPTERCFSFGVQANEDQHTNAVNNYSMSLVLQSRDGPTQEELQWIDTFNSIVTATEAWILDNKEELGKFDLERSDLKKLNPLWWKKETVNDPTTGKLIERRVPGRGPTLYPKLQWNKQSGDITTKFYDASTDDPINPIDLISQRCNACAAIRIEGLYIGKTISLQMKMMECNVEIVDTSYKRLLVGSQARSPIMVPPTILSRQESSVVPANDESGNDTDASLEEDDVATGTAASTKAPEPPPTTTTAKKRVVKRTVRKPVA